MKKSNHLGGRKKKQGKHPRTQAHNTHKASTPEETRRELSPPSDIITAHHRASLSEDGVGILNGTERTS